MTGLFTGFAQLDLTYSSDNKTTYLKVTQLNFNIILFLHSAALSDFLLPQLFRSVPSDFT